MRRIFIAFAAVALGSAVVAQQSPYESLAPTLAEWIIEFRDDAIERGAEKAPVEIREALSGFVPAAVLESVRWRVDGTVAVVGQNLFFTGPVRAVTLDNVILFADAQEAADATLWAHELRHVMQYREWGVEGFAARYLDDHRAIEHEAREFRWRWMKATGRVPRV